MLVVVVAIVVVAAAVLLGAFLVWSGRGVDVEGDVQRFHRARGITTAWSEQGPESLPLVEQDAEQGDADRS